MHRSVNLFLLQDAMARVYLWRLLDIFFFSITIPFLIFQILIGGNISGNTVLEDDFTTLDSRKWLLHPGGTKMPVCGSTGDALVFIEKASTRYVVTTDIVVNEDSFLQIDFAASCSVTDSCYGNHFVVIPALPLPLLYRKVLLFSGSIIHHNENWEAKASCMFLLRIVIPSFLF